jgi:hypothetical protein
MSFRYPNHFYSIGDAYSRPELIEEESLLDELFEEFGELDYSREYNPGKPKTPEERAAVVERERKRRAAMTPEQKARNVESERRRRAAMTPEERAAFRALTPEQKAAKQSAYLKDAAQQTRPPHKPDPQVAREVKKSVESFLVSKGLPKDTPYALLAGAAMYFHGLRPELKDADIVVPGLGNKNRAWGSVREPSGHAGVQEGTQPREGSGRHQGDPEAYGRGLRRRLAGR